MAQRERSGRAIGVLAVLVVAAIAGLSVASSLLGDDGDAGGAPPDESTVDGSTGAALTTSGPPLGDRAALPQPAAGRFAGRLLVVDADCRVVQIDLASLTQTVVVDDVPGCALQLSPHGAYAIVGTRPGRETEVLRLSPQAEPAGTGPALGPPGYGAPAVSDHGAAAVCSTDPASGQAQVEVRELDGRVRGSEGCHPAFAGEQVYVASRERDVAVHDGDGRVVVRRGALPRRTRGDVLLASSPDGGLIGVLARAQSGDAVDLGLFGDDGAPRGGWQDVHSGADLRTLRLASTGTAAAFDVNGVWRLATLAPSAADTVEAVAGARILDVDFAPDGAAAAVLVDGAILVVDSSTLGPVAAIPIDARAVRWVP